MGVLVLVAVGCGEPIPQAPTTPITDSGPTLTSPPLTDPGQAAPPSSLPGHKPMAVEDVPGLPEGLWVARDYDTKGAKPRGVLEGAKGGRSIVLGLEGSQAVDPLSGGGPGVQSPDGRYVVYNSWTEVKQLDHSQSLVEQGIDFGDPVATPSLRLLDLETGEDRLFEQGAHTIAWRRDGTIAYMKGDESFKRLNVPYTGQVVVRSSLDAPAEVWTTEPGDYMVYGWAGETLLVYRLFGELQSADLLALDSAGKVRLLGQLGVMTISPDGERLLVAGALENFVGPAELAIEYRIVRVADWETESILDPTSVPELQGVSGSATWVGDLVAAAHAEGVALLRVDEAGISFDRLLKLDLKHYPYGAEGPLLSADGTQVVTLATETRGNSPHRYVALSCDLVKEKCKRQAPAQQFLAPIYNPSRPL